MNNYQKAKEEGMEQTLKKLDSDFGHSDNCIHLRDFEGADGCTCIYGSIREHIAELLSSFAEKIKEGRDKDLELYTGHLEHCEFFEDIKECDCGLNKLLSSDSQTIKE